MFYLQNYDQVFQSGDVIKVLDRSALSCVRELGEMHGKRVWMTQRFRWYQASSFRPQGHGAAVGDMQDATRPQGPTGLLYVPPRLDFILAPQFKRVIKNGDVLSNSTSPKPIINQIIWLISFIALTTHFNFLLVWFVYCVFFPLSKLLPPWCGPLSVLLTRTTLVPRIEGDT